MQRLDQKKVYLHPLSFMLCIINLGCQGLACYRWFGLLYKYFVVSEAVPVQNQTAARKLLQKMNQTTHEDKSYRDHRNTGKGRQEETQVFTLEEWEKRKGFDLKPLASGSIQDVSRDEELARQLQKQLDLEDFHVGFVS